ncbi:phage tail assembly protein [Afifella aestuarii]|uniref:phage tail assembly protein n=1 Tax=Afifella aestuarii TaxID=1909496 RepID=UPI000FE3F21B|nr:phage tail assembly protein [Afifella aestuarii]
MATIKLSKSYEASGQVFDEVTLRPPTCGEYFAIGEPQEWVLSGGVRGTRMLATDLGVVRQYMDKLCTAPGGQYLDVLDLKDAIAVKDAVLGFFTEARSSTRNSTSSSSTSTGGRKTSKS